MDTDVTAVVRYVYRIKARSAGGLSELSDFFEANVPEGSPDPEATREGAVSLGDITELSSTQCPKHTITGGSDAVDYFNFTIVEPKRITVGLRQRG